MLLEMIKKTVILTLLAFAVAAFAGCGKKAPPQPPDIAVSAVRNIPAI